MRSRASHPAGPHGRLAKKNGKSVPHCGGREASTQSSQQFVKTAVTAPLHEGCVVWSLHQLIHTVITTRLDFGNSILYILPNNKIERLQRI